MFTIYQIINILNQESYIGFTVRSLKTRWIEHQSSSKGKSHTHFHNAVRKYGVKNFKLEIIEEGWDLEIGKNIREPYWISALKPEYNMTEGGEGQSIGYIPSQTTRNKSSISHKTSQAAINQRKILHTSHIGVPRPDSFKDKMAIIMSGNKYGNFKDRSYMKTPEYRSSVSAGKRKHVNL